jgi:5'-deoxynucleotidase YfbR-like HD superfamily hydrolase
VAQFALIHDMPEVYAGDTSTLRIDGAGKAAKREREAAAVERLDGEFGTRLPWVPFTLALYEEQRLPEARFVRGLDKCLPKIVHLLDDAAGLREERMGSAELAGVFKRQRADMETYAGEFTELMDLRAELVGRVVALVAEQEAAA